MQSGPSHQSHSSASVKCTVCLDVNKIFACFRVSPDEWESAHPCESEPDELENGLNLLNCLWHNIGALMQQGSDLAPK